ncbi:MAG: sensor histidine kinase, partial [Betaproteobacteria bacterium]
MSPLANIRTKASSRRGIGFYLISLIILAVVPLVVIASLLVVRQSTLQREALEHSLLATALALSVAVDRQLNSYQVMLETLAEADELQRNDVDAFHALSERVALRHGVLFISLFDHAGKQIFNTLRPQGVSLPTPFRDSPPPGDNPDRPAVGDPTSLKTVFATGKPVNSDLFYGLVAQRLLFTVNIPVLRNAKVEYILNAAFEPDVMTRVLQENPQFRGVPAVIYDRQGFVVGRWKDAEQYVGRLTRSFGREDVTKNDSGVGAGVTIEGLPMFFAYAHSATTGWGVNVGTDRTQLDQDIYTSLTVGGVLAAGGLLLGVLLALRLASRLRKSIAGLAESASRNERPAKGELQTRELVQLERALAEAASVREAQAQERESRMVAEARKDEAEEANRMKDHFIAVLSHELRNPLAPIRNSVELLRALQARGDFEAMSKIVDMLDRQSRQLARLVNDLLDVSRITTAKIALRRERIDLRAVAHHAVESVTPALEAHGHHLTWDWPEQPVEVMGDFARLSQVISNLLDNAAKYTPHGGQIMLSITVERDYARLAVQDNGRGIEGPFLPRVFTAFLYGDSQAFRNEGGLGLGLSLAKALVGLHGGSIEAYSDGLDRGSTFTFRVPLADPLPASARAAVESAPVEMPPAPPA